ncbi:hypothetical protein BQ8794_10418 [Mesorhizobium prunaredense]|uniref:GNAT family N-acetyltransferase n=1 Tax=Mesorhizobium prunaredense TaxID=1631249 RepID=A0A1R3UZH6_9HYPH|nr:hypothetical protein BQ8794_10418 [Mesorhizobium prunaredense]
MHRISPAFGEWRGRGGSIVLSAFPLQQSWCPMNTQSVTFAPFEAHHLEEATALSRAAGWPHRKEDWAMIWSLSEGQVALEGGRVVGTAFMTQAISRVPRTHASLPWPARPSAEAD